MLPPEERFAYVALALVPGIGVARLTNLRAACGSWTGALAAPVAFLRTVPAMNRAAATAVGMADPDAVRRMLDQLDADGGFVLTPLDGEFPAGLRPIADPPTVLFGTGRRELLTEPAVAVVGTRHPTGYGAAVTRDLAATAALTGLVVVSGMARGLDAVAHWAAVEAQGGTIGVLGNGLGVVYPAVNRTLYQRVAAEGLLLTELPPGERPNAGSFSRRNRIIAGLARVTVVTEAGDRSGACITASQALEQGRDVLAVPGPITSRTSVGANRLIRDGAGPYLEPVDLLSRYPELGPRAISAPPADRRAPAGLPAELARVLEALDGMPRTVESLASELRLPPSDVLRAASELEIVGLADREGAGFRRAG